MSNEQYWLSHRDAFLHDAKKTSDDGELLTLYQRLLEQMKTNALSSHPQDDMLRQQIALLFMQASQGAELFLAKDLPSLVKKDLPASDTRSKLTMLLARPIALYAVLGLGLLTCLGSLRTAWLQALFFAAALASNAIRSLIPSQVRTSVSVETNLRIPYLDDFILRQAKLLDAHTQDLCTLLDEAFAPPDTPLEPAALSLCQHVWTLANAQGSTEGALYDAEKLLRHNDLRWQEYDPSKKHFFIVLPTKKESRTLCPALTKVSDDTLVAKGQYLEHRQSTDTPE